MLVLSRKRNERIRIRSKSTGQITWLTLVEVRGDKVRLGFQADDDVEIHRAEVVRNIEAAAAAAQP
jgi:carbon storage regulator